MVKIAKKNFEDGLNPNRFKRVLSYSKNKKIILICIVLFLVSALLYLKIHNSSQTTRNQVKPYAVKTVFAKNIETRAKTTNQTYLNDFTVTEKGILSATTNGLTYSENFKEVWSKSTDGKGLIYNKLSSTKDNLYAASQEVVFGQSSLINYHLKNYITKFDYSGNVVWTYQLPDDINIVQFFPSERGIDINAEFTKDIAINNAVIHSKGLGDILKLSIDVSSSSPTISSYKHIASKAEDYIYDVTTGYYNQDILTLGDAATISFKDQSELSLSVTGGKFICSCYSYSPVNDFANPIPFSSITRIDEKNSMPHEVSFLDDGGYSNALSYSLDSTTYDTSDSDSIVGANESMDETLKVLKHSMVYFINKFDNKSLLASNIIGTYNKPDERNFFNDMKLVALNDKVYVIESGGLVKVMGKNLDNLSEFTLKENGSWYTPWGTKLFNNKIYVASYEDYESTSYPGSVIKIKEISP